MTLSTSIPLPCLKKVGGRWQLQVDGESYLILGAELQNSSMSSARYMKTVWKKLQEMNINTILGPVAWEDVEPEEGRFDFSELDAILCDARSFGFRIILLWFGSWKNGMSCYVPSWVKKDINRFPRMRVNERDGSVRHTNVISNIADECFKADCKAFTTLMQHVKNIDTQRTVLAMQIQNEVGLLGGSRDTSPMAEKVFQSEVPVGLVEFLRTSWSDLLPDLTRNFPVFANTRNTLDSQHDKRTKSWEDYFGRSLYTDELFMAYHYAIYIEKLAVAGKNTYDIPVFTNAWLPKPGVQDASGNVAAGGAMPGDFPSGGPVPGMLDVWQRFAPTLDFISPDIYAADYSVISAKYTRSGQPFFIPEQRRDEYGARRVWEAIGEYGALGVAPFGVDTLGSAECAFTSHYKLLASISLHILKARETSAFICGFYFDELPTGDQEGETRIMKVASSYELVISRSFVFGTPGPGYGLIIELEEDRFLLIGKGYKVEFKSRSSASTVSGLLRLEEKEVADDGSLRTGRILNGDETRSDAWANMPADQPHYGTAFIPVAIPARTAIAEAQVYAA